MAYSSKTKCIEASMGIADTASWYCAIALVGLILLGSMPIKDESGGNDESSVRSGRQLLEHGGCDEIYVVGEGETLHTISDKCGDPFIVEQNPHIHDPDDVFPGLVIKITPFKNINLST